MKNKILALALLTALAPAIQAQPPQTDYSAFNPFSPACVEPEPPYHWYTDDGGVRTPYTIPVNTLQLYVGGSYDFTSRTGAGATQSIDQDWTLGSIGLKAGLLKDLELDAFYQGYKINNATTKTPGSTVAIPSPVFSLIDVPGRETTDTTYGWGNLNTSLKYDFLDEHQYSVAGILDMHWPVESGLHTRNRFEGGPALAGSYSPFQNVELRVGSGVTFFENNHDCMEECFCEDALFEYQFCPRTAGYAGFRAQVSTERHSNWDGSFVAGFYYDPLPNVRLFAESGFGVNGRGPDFSPSIGIAFLLDPAK